MDFCFLLKTTYHWWSEINMKKKQFKNKKKKKKKKKLLDNTLNQQFIDCISKTNNTKVDNAKDLNF